MNKFKLRIITPKKVVLERTAESVTLPTVEGEITILFNHVPLFSLLKEGAVIVREGGDESFFSIGGGYVETTGKEVNVLVSRAYHQSEIDEAAIEEAKKDAAARLKDAKTDSERQQAMEILRRSTIDLKVLKKRRRAS